MLTRICDGVCELIETLSWLAFAVLIATVALQVIARNVLNVPVIWTGDLALLLFTWLVFMGAASGLRKGAHYMVDMLPTNRPSLALFLEVLSLTAGFCVAWILGVHGWTLAGMRASGEIQSLGISRFWIYLALPVCGWFMALFLLEMSAALIRDTWQGANQARTRASQENGEA